MTVESEHNTDSHAARSVKSKSSSPTMRSSIVRKGASIYASVRKRTRPNTCTCSCRRKDNNKTITFIPPSFEHSPPPSPFAQFTCDDVPSRDIVPQRSPTAPNMHPMSSTFSDLASDDESRYSGDESRKDSEAARYLRQFQSQSAEATRTSWRPRYNRASTSTTGFSIAPSLSHTPSHTPTSTASASLAYSPSRPLPMRNNPYNSYASRSIDLVTPFVTAPTTAPPSLKDSSLKSQATLSTTTGVAAAEMMYEKKQSLPPASPGQGSLRQLFRFSEMQAPPSLAEARRPGWP